MGVCFAGSLFAACWLTTACAQAVVPKKNNSIEVMIKFFIG
jgi:hypothetical protein